MLYCWIDWRSFLASQVRQWLNSYLSESGTWHHWVRSCDHVKSLFIVMQMICSCSCRCHFDGLASNKLGACLAAFKRWLSANFLLLNSAKIEMITGPARLSHFNHLWRPVIHCRDKLLRVTNLDLVFDKTLSFNLHIKEVTRFAVFLLGNIAKIRPALSLKHAEILIRVFVTLRLDYCNALLSRLPKKSVQSLQCVQNTAAEQITQVLAPLHCHPVQVRAHFKVLLLTYKILSGIAPSYLSDLVKLCIPRCTPRSQGSGVLSVPKVHEKTIGLFFLFTGTVEQSASWHQAGMFCLPWKTVVYLSYLVLLDLLNNRNGFYTLKYTIH